MLSRTFGWILALLLVISLPNVSSGFTGRSAGLGDPTGLVEDEADFLVHPALIPFGPAGWFFLDYRYTYTRVDEWDFNRRLPGPVGNRYYHSFVVPGQVVEHDGLVGTILSLGAGRLGFFLSYHQAAARYEGDAYGTRTAGVRHYDVMVDADLEDFSIRAVFGAGRPEFAYGAEIGLARRDEKNNVRVWDRFRYKINEPFGMYFSDEHGTMHQMTLPYDSRYWETTFKASLAARTGPAVLTFTSRAGFIHGDNSYHYHENVLTGGGVRGKLLPTGDVQGASVGADMWVRFDLGDGLSLPIILRADYSKKTRDGRGVDIGTMGVAGSYDHKTEARSFEVGLGVAKQYPANSRIAAGIYYRYAESMQSFRWNAAYDVLGVPGAVNYAFNKIPDTVERRLTLKTAWEKAWSDDLVFRAGVTLYYAWIDQGFEESSIVDFGGFVGLRSNVFRLSGHRRGISASLGASFDLGGLILEPYLNAGYEQVMVSGFGMDNPVVHQPPYEMAATRDEWSVSLGCAFVYR